MYLSGNQDMKGYLYSETFALLRVIKTSEMSHTLLSLF